MIPYHLSAEPVREWGVLPDTECPEPMCRGGEVSYPEWEGRVEICDLCDGSGRVPVELSWPCPTCGGAGGSMRWKDGGNWFDRCPHCNGEGVVHEGWLALGAAAWVRPSNTRLPADRVPASLSELVRVQRVPVVDDYESACSAYEGPVAVEVTPNGRVLFFDAWDSATEDEGTDITDQFASLPKPGEWVWRIVERVTLSDPITGWPCPPRPCIDCLVARIARKCTHRVPVDAEIPLPQQVGWYQADDALVAEIERRKP